MPYSSTVSRRERQSRSQSWQPYHLSHFNDKRMQRGSLKDMETTTGSKSMGNPGVIVGSTHMNRPIIHHSRQQPSSRLTIVHTMSKEMHVRGRYPWWVGLQVQWLQSGPTSAAEVTMAKVRTTHVIVLASSSYSSGVWTPKKQKQTNKQKQKKKKKKKKNRRNS